MTIQNQPSSSNATPSPVTARQPARRGWLFLLIALAVIAFIMIRDLRRSIAWVDDYPAARALAQKQDKPLLILFHLPGDDDSAKLRAQTFTNDRIIRYVNDHFIPVLVNADQHKPLAAQFQVTQIPTTVAASPDEKQHASVPGFVIPAEFLGRLQRNLKKITPAPDS